MEALAMQCSSRISILLYLGLFGSAYLLVEISITIRQSLQRLYPFKFKSFDIKIRSAIPVGHKKRPNEAKIHPQARPRRKRKESQPQDRYTSLKFHRIIIRTLQRSSIISVKPRLDRIGIATSSYHCTGYHQDDHATSFRLVRTNREIPSSPTSKHQPWVYSRPTQEEFSMPLKSPINQAQRYATLESLPNSKGFDQIWEGTNRIKRNLKGLEILFPVVSFLREGKNMVDIRDPLSRWAHPFPPWSTQAFGFSGDARSFEGHRPAGRLHLDPIFVGAFRTQHEINR
jgi:hypothetical protein